MARQPASTSPVDQAEETPAPEATDESPKLPKAALAWLAGRTVAATRETENSLVVVSWPDYQKASFPR
jgi:hypothetical protein